ncbi:MAG: T9SS C-terminal target domain-containing protein [Ignavibacteriales bacterium]|nr:MAG: T9SS C-terminal target domain-containing protein [Ignavibacteriales bacterium]
MGSTTILYKSTDDGLTWTGVQGLPSGYYYMNLKAYGDYLFCAHMTGIYFQHKDSTNWINANLNIIPSFISCGEIDDNYIYAGSMDSLIYRRRISEIFTDVEEQPTQPEEFKLEQNYPNPFNPSTRIHYQVSSISQVTLKVFDVLGNEIATLVNEEKPAGSYEVEFQSTVINRQLASGIYFYQLKADEFIQTKKMLMIK